MVIPARAGSKGLPKKNIQPLGGVPLTLHSLTTARRFFPDTNICVSTDDIALIHLLEEDNYKVPFIRPKELATDDASSDDVIRHSIRHYGLEKFDSVLLLQPTSPFRKDMHIMEAMSAFEEDLDMVVSVTETSANPYYVLFEEDQKGYLKKSKEGKFSSRQVCPTVYEFNGSIYVIKVPSILQADRNEFERVKKYVMPKEYSVDIDTPMDWAFAEFLLEREYVRLDN